MRTRSPNLKLNCQDICLTIDDKEILKNASMSVRSGEMVVILGPTGAGKTTLLNIISGRQPYDSGQITLNGLPFSKRLRRRMAFVQQNDCFYTRLTLFETLMFTANLRMPSSASLEDKKEVIQKIVDALDLNKCLHTVVGDAIIKGLSGGEMKRTNIASELLVDSEILLLDEPTSNLDSSTAYSTMMYLKRISQQYNKIVVLTIHQPSSRIYQLFNKIMLIVNGQVAYYGRTKHVLPFFEKMGYYCEKHFNPADFLMERMKDDDDKTQMYIEKASKIRLSQRETTSSFREGQNGVTLTDYASEDSETDDTTVSLLPDSGKNNVNAMYINVDGRDEYEMVPDRWVISWWAQYKILSWRALKQTFATLRDGHAIIQTLIVGVLCCMGYFKTGLTFETSRDVFGLMYFNVGYWTFIPAMDIISQYGMETAVLNKEQASGAYRMSAYYCARMTGELPYLFTLPLVMTALFFWVSDIGDAWQFFAIIAIIVVQCFAHYGLGLLLSASSKNIRIAITTLFSMLVTMYLLGGFFSRNMPRWLYWIKYLSLFYHTYSAVIIILAEGMAPESCLNTLDIPLCRANGTAMATPQDLLQAANVDLPFCAYIAIMVGYTIIFRLGSYFVLRFNRHPPL